MLTSTINDSNSDNVISHVDVISKTKHITHHVLTTLSTCSAIIQRLTLTWCVVKNRTAALDEL